MHNTPRDRRDVELALHQAFNNGGSDPNLEVVEILPLPSLAGRTSSTEDKLVALRTFEEALAIFDRSAEGCSQFIVQVRPRKARPSAADSRAETAPSPAPTDGLYAGDGKLNVAYLLKNAEILLRSGDHALARNIYRSVYQSGEKTAAALLGLGRCAEAEGKLADAVEKYEESIAYHPSAEVYRTLAAAYRKLGRDRHAAESLERALTLRDLTKDERADLHATIAQAWFALQKPDLAENHLRRSIEIRPNATAFTQLATQAREQKKLQAAKDFLLKARQIEPRNADVLHSLGEIALTEGNAREAHDCFAASLDAKIFNPPALFNLIKLAYELKTYATATRIVEDYVRAAPVNTHLLYSLAGLQFHLGRTDASIRTCQDILKISPEHAGAKDLLKLQSRQGGQDGDANRLATR